MEPILIPTMLFWENGNTWYGSKGQARFFIQPANLPGPEEGQEQRRLAVELWRGPMAKQFSQILTTADFPLSEDGLSQLVDWLEEQALQLNS